MRAHHQNPTSVDTRARSRSLPGGLHRAMGFNNNAVLCMPSKRLGQFVRSQRPARVDERAGNRAGDRHERLRHSVNVLVTKGRKHHMKSLWPQGCGQRRGRRWIVCDVQNRVNAIHPQRLQTPRNTGHCQPPTDFGLADRDERAELKGQGGSAGSVAPVVLARKFGRRC